MTTHKQNKLVSLGIFAFIAVVALLIISSATFLTIDPGEKGVLFKKFSGGLDKDHIYGQGFHVIAPWNEMILYDTRILESFEKMEVLSKNGLNIKVELSYRYQPLADEIGYLHDEVGANYLEKIIKPEIRSATREVIGKYLPEELYSTKREAIQDEIFKQTENAIKPKHLRIDAVLIRQVELPKTLQEAIERKLKEEQSSLEYEYRLARERKEAERKVIEAQAKADANKIVSASLTDKILQDKGIEATIKLANSPNTKVIVVGGNENGLPLILGK